MKPTKKWIVFALKMRYFILAIFVAVYIVLCAWVSSLLKVHLNVVIILSTTIMFAMVAALPWVLSFVAPYIKEISSLWSSNRRLMKIIGILLILEMATACISFLVMKGDTLSYAINDEAAEQRAIKDSLDYDFEFKNKSYLKRHLFRRLQSLKYVDRELSLLGERNPSLFKDLLQGKGVLKNDSCTIIFHQQFNPPESPAYFDVQVYNGEGGWLGSFSIMGHQYDAAIKEDILKTEREYDDASAFIKNKTPEVRLSFLSFLRHFLNGQIEPVSNFLTFLFLIKWLLNALIPFLVGFVAHAVLQRYDKTNQSANS